MRAGYILVADSNPMRPSKDKPEFIVATGFTKALKELFEHGDVQLFVPSIVKGELVAQRLRTAIRLRNELLGKIETIKAITGFDRWGDFQCNDDELRARIKQKFDQWVDENGVTTIEARPDLIDWAALIKGAVYRLPPFEPAEDDTEKESSEKGFKDALILETLVQIENDNASHSVVLITKDKLLREAALGRMKSRLVFDSISSFKAHLIQLRDQNSESFALSVAQAARDAWDTSKQPNLFDQLKVAEHVQNEFAATLANPPVRMPDGMLSRSHFAQQANVRIPLGGEATIVSPPEYLGERAGRWEWKTDVELSQLFQKRSFHPDSGLSPHLLGEDIRKAKFTIFWDSAKGSRPEIADPKLDHLLYRGIWVQPASFEEVMGAI